MEQRERRESTDRLQGDTRDRAAGCQRDRNPGLQELLEQLNRARQRLDDPERSVLKRIPLSDILLGRVVRGERPGRERVEQVLSCRGRQGLTLSLDMTDVEHPVGQTCDQGRLSHHARLDL